MLAATQGHQKKGAKTDAILQLLEADGVSRPSAIGPRTGLSGKEVSSRISVLVSQGRVARERSAAGNPVVRFVGWNIQNSRVVKPEPVPACNFLDSVWGLPNAKDLIALADALSEDVRVAQGHRHTNPVPTTPFVQVLLRAKEQGRLKVYTHCLADDESESESARNAPRSRGVHPEPAATRASAVSHTAPVPATGPAESNRRAAVSF